MMSGVSDNSLQFVNEIKEKIEKDYYAFHEYQMIVLKTLRAFHDLCGRNNIVYYLAYGTLLGLVRDGGQIPWDYDVDVWVPLYESNKLMRAIDSELAEEFHYTTRFKDRKCRTYTLKLAPKGYDCEVIHVDIFWLNGATNNEKLRARTYDLGMKYHKLMLRKFINVKYLFFQSKILKIAYSVKSLPAKLCPAAFITKMWKRLTCENVDSTDWVTDGYHVFSKDFFENSVDIWDKDGYKYKIPVGYKEILSQSYGDYMKFPSIELRVAEFQRALNRLNKLAKL